jgi:hypothetical protein
MKMTMIDPRNLLYAALLITVTIEAVVTLIDFFLGGQNTHPLLVWLAKKLYPETFCLVVIAHIGFGIYAAIDFLNWPAWAMVTSTLIYWVLCLGDILQMAKLAQERHWF